MPKRVLLEAPNTKLQCVRIDGFEHGFVRLTYSRRCACAEQMKMSISNMVESCCVPWFALV